MIENLTQVDASDFKRQIEHQRKNQTDIAPGLKMGLAGRIGRGHISEILSLPFRPKVNHIPIVIPMEQEKI